MTYYDLSFLINLAHLLVQKCMHSYVYECTMYTLCIFLYKICVRHFSIFFPNGKCVVYLRQVIVETRSKGESLLATWRQGSACQNLTSCNNKQYTRKFYTSCSWILYGLAGSVRYKIGKIIAFATTTISESFIHNILEFSGSVWQVQFYARLSDLFEPSKWQSKPAVASWEPYPSHLMPIHLLLLLLLSASN